MSTRPAEDSFDLMSSLSWISIAFRVVMKNASSRVSDPSLAETSSAPARPSYRASRSASENSTYRSSQARSNLFPTRTMLRAVLVGA